MDWKPIVTHLYANINAVGGTLHHWLPNKLNSESTIRCISIGFFLENFVYEDPFYGSNEAKNNFEMFFEIDSADPLSYLKTIRDVENKSFEFDKEERIGCFSNSLHFSVPYCKFGAINDGKIPFEMEYILTNSDSYGQMDGSFEEHSTLSGHLKTVLDVFGVRICLNDRQDIKSLLQFIDNTVYEPSKFHLAKGHVSHAYEIPLKL